MEDKKYNILVVHNYYQVSGGEDSVVENEINMLKEHGHNVFLYSKNNNEIKQYNVFKKILLIFKTIFSIKTYKEVKKIIKENKIDIVHVHNTLPLISQSVYYAANKMKVPIIQTIHNFRFICPNALLYRDGHICEDCINKGMKCAIKHKCYRNSRFQTMLCVLNMIIHRHTGIYKKINFICLTDFNKEKLSTLKYIDPNKIYVKPNFVKRFDGEILPIDKRKKQYIYVGRLDETKGIKELFEEWKKVDKDTKLLVYGNGPLSEWCNQFVEDNHVSNIELMGFQKKEIIMNSISESKALILLTRVYEGFPMTFVESFSTGTPVIASNIGNCGMLIENGINGYKINNKTNISDVIEKLENNKDIYNSTLNCFEKYRYQNNYKILSDIYNKLI